MHSMQQIALRRMVYETLEPLRRTVVVAVVFVLYAEFTNTHPVVN